MMPRSLSMQIPHILQKPLNLLLALPLGIRFIIAGGTGTVFNLCVLYVLTDFFGVWYLASTTISFLVGSVFSFTLQKFLTFRHTNASGLQREFPIFLTVGGINLFLNSALMYTLVDIVGVWYMLAQIISTGIISIESFITYRYIVFKKPQ